MRFLKIILSVIFLSMIISCKTNKIVNENNTIEKEAKKKYKIDKRLVGVWEGIVYDTVSKQVMKEWIMSRKKNGKFNLKYRIHQERESVMIEEAGDWNTKKGKYYEYKNDSLYNVNIFSYEVIGQDRIDFKTLEDSLSVENYTFTDHRRSLKRDNNGPSVLGWVGLVLLESFVEGFFNVIFEF